MSRAPGADAGAGGGAGPHPHPEPTVPAAPPAAAPDLVPGSLAKDTARDRVGVVVVRTDACVRLRPLKGGAFWEAAPTEVTRLSEREAMSARLVIANAGRRWGK
ncbi:hypothetical protein [Streptomyces paludis]|uniref:hypothetical protein n=1 Tax=Streptomyces paludis TaxID=2282738 RepID=UPI0015F2DF09|nr:hypothetical protein [Streptomyces paludis]